MPCGNRTAHLVGNKGDIMHYLTRAAIVAVAASCTTGCIGTANPVFNSSVKDAYIYSAHENRGGFGVPAMVVGATGEVRYCQAGMPQLVSARQKEAYAAIARACGGEDQYSIRGEMMADATGSMMGVDVKCTGNSGRAIVFKCHGKQPPPSGNTK